jgi:hypothetical protein
MRTMAEHTAVENDRPATGYGTPTQIFSGLLWLGITVWVARATLTTGGVGLTGPLGSAAAALPGVVAATLLTSATIASAASGRFRGAGRRLLVGLGVGVLFGAITAAGVRLAYGNAPSITVLAVVVGAAGVLAGAAAVLPHAVLEAALWATTWVFFAGIIFGVLQVQLTTLLGGGPAADPAAQATANTRFTYGQSILTGLAAAYFAYRNLSGEKKAWPWFLIAGALPGGLLLAAEGFIRLGGSSVIRLVHATGVDNAALVGLTDWSRLRHALIVFAVGGVVAAIRGAIIARRPD